MILINSILKKSNVNIVIFTLFFFSIFSLNVKADEYMKDMKTNNRRPTIHIKGLEVDSDGNIYISTMWGINVYNNSGEFIYGLQVDTSGAYEMMIDDKGNLNVAIYKKDSTYIYNRDGMLIEVIEDKGNKAFNYYEKNNKVKFDSKGNKYSLTKYLGFYKVTKTTPEGTEHTILKSSFLNSFMEFLPFIFLILTAIIVIFLKSREYKRNTTNSLKKRY